MGGGGTSALPEADPGKEEEVLVPGQLEVSEGTSWGNFCGGAFVRELLLFVFGY